MGLTAKDSGGGDFVLAPQGTHPAVCCAVIDLGTQYSEKWRKHQHKVLIGWELDCDSKRDDGAPHTVWRRYSVSLHQKAELRKVLEAWRGRNFTAEELDGFDLRNIAGKPCIVTVNHTDRDGQTFANISSVSALPKKMVAPTPSKPPVVFDVEDPDMAAFSAFSEKLQDTIKASAEWKEKNGVGSDVTEPPPHGDDDIPF